jgi:hypothetical protein
MTINENTIIPLSDKILRKAIYEAFDGKCFYTGRQVSFEEMHIDHINPRANGGTDCISNYVLSCNYINLKKNGYVFNDLIEISSCVIKNMFSPLVVELYNQMKLNEAISNSHIEINYFLKSEVPKENRGKFRNYVRTKLIPIKIYKQYRMGKKIVKPTKPKLYYQEEEIKTLYNKWV